MNLAKLFEMQKELDARILEEHPVQEGEDRLAKKILALQVELGELANCWRGFKYWSYNQKPKTEELGECPLCKGTGDLGTVWAENCIECGGSGKVVVKNPLLEEYVDCLHFIISIGLDIGLNPEEIELEPCHCENVTNQFIDVIYSVCLLKYAEETKDLYSDYLEYDYMLNEFNCLGKGLGFTWDEIEQAYIKKNKVNHQRQEEGY